MTKRTKFFRSRLRGILWGQRGSFTLESALVMPLLLTMLFLFLLFSLYLYQKVIIYYSASSAAERTAFSWDNSHRDWRNGMLEQPLYDGLYWRMTEDRLLESLFGLGGQASAVTLDLPGQATAGENVGEGLAERKLTASSSWIGAVSASSLTGSIQYEPGAVKRTIELKLKQPVSIAPLERMLGLTEPKTAAAAGIVDPVEFIRSVDLARYYNNRFASGWGGKEKMKAEKTLGKYGKSS
ncbi:TadE/TadG family type IV pilus assembly protein [Paenibacillus sp. NPDC058071]|uniref:TadE/TadG family type IV pilus assembly protein n=1 Tax=Paenibacillus sp. NPDC058071 TaxID=3346326 RepID=UPI0036DBF2E9